MAKRKRLTPPDPAQIAPVSTLETKSMFDGPARCAPIAEVAAEASAASALREMSDTLRSAREEGRMVLDVPLHAVEAGYLTRDRTLVADEDAEALMASLRARGQQTPIEVAPLPGERYGLISGWRRLAALRALHEETGESRFATVRALLRSPSEASEAYLAMVEENEIRADLSYYERARIVVKSVEQGVFKTHKAALEGLFGAASRARRSKIRSFVSIVSALDGALHYPEALTERTGLTLAKALEGNPALAGHLRQSLDRAAPADADAERVQILRVIERGKPAETVPEKPARPVAAGTGRIVIESDLAVIALPNGRLQLEGRKVTDALRRDLVAWLKARKAR